MKSLLQFVPKSREELKLKVKNLLSSSALQSAIWVLIGSGGGQMIRLLGNLILTRLLFPEAFGIMAIIFAIIIGLGQLSDIGVRQSVINSDRTEDKNFMRTAWTMQVLQNTFMAITAAALAYPAATFYNEAILAPMMMIIALSIFISGFRSIATVTYDKRMELKTQMVTDMAIQAISLVVIIIWAYFWRNIWAMAAGQIVTAILQVVVSYVFFNGHHSRFAWEKKSVQTLIGFGKWIFISSTISFLTNQGDRLILGIFLSMAQLGKYSLASNWSSIVGLLSVGLSFRVLHPYFKQAIDNHSNFSRIHKVRFTLNGIYTLICVSIAVLGDKLIVFLYDDRYVEAGWMLQILALGQIARSLTYTLMPFMLAQGDSFSQMKFSVVNALVLVTCLFTGGYLGATEGIIIGYAMSTIISHPAMIFYASRHGYNCTRSDLGMILGSMVVCLVIWWWLDAPFYQVLVNMLSGT
jgi:O-antigen/teichoic acid export membrane protein